MVITLKNSPKPQRFNLAIAQRNKLKRMSTQANHCKCLVNTIYYWKCLRASMNSDDEFFFHVFAVTKQVLTGYNISGQHLLNASTVIFTPLWACRSIAFQPLSTNYTENINDVFYRSTVIYSKQNVQETLHQKQYRYFIFFLYIS